MDWTGVLCIVIVLAIGVAFIGWMIFLQRKSERWNENKGKDKIKKEPAVKKGKKNSEGKKNSVSAVTDDFLEQGHMRRSRLDEIPRDEGGKPEEKFPIDQSEAIAPGAYSESKGIDDGRGSDNVSECDPSSASTEESAMGSQQPESLGTGKVVCKGRKERRKQKKAEREAKKQHRAMSRKLQDFIKQTKQCLSNMQDVMQAIELWQPVFHDTAELFAQLEYEGDISKLRQEAARLSAELERTKGKQEKLVKQLADKEKILETLRESLQEESKKNAALQERNDHLKIWVAEDAGYEYGRGASLDYVREIENFRYARDAVSSILAICKTIEEYKTYEELRRRVNQILLALTIYKEKTGGRED